ncbi:beta-lactamase [Flammeovirgaceae bacterium 311]|nr:beta-lactamase [Flammeovirgaceae bacterium 311]
MLVAGSLPAVHLLFQLNINAMPRIICAFFYIAVAITACQSSDMQQQSDQEATLVNSQVKARIDSTLKSLVDSGQIAGVSALIFEKDKEVYYNAFGYADREAGTEMDRNTLVRIYSMTKPITGVALMQLYEQGAFQLDDPVEKYAPEFANVKVFAGVDASGNTILESPQRAITIRDLTRHTAGFAKEDHPQLGELVKKADAMNKENTLAQMAKKLGSLPLAFHPGEEWSYGVSVDVQAFLVERLSGKPFDQYVEENILDPLGMENTRYVPRDFTKLAAMYRMSEDGQLGRIPDEEANAFNGRPWPLKPGGWGYTSTLDDYMQFARMLVNGGTLGEARVLKPETVKLMATNHLSDSVSERMWLPSKGRVGFGIDFAVRLFPPADQEENHGMVGEFFWDGAASTLFWVDPENKLTAVLFVQVFPFDRALHKKFRDAVYGNYKGPVSTALEKQ